MKADDNTQVLARLAAADAVGVRDVATLAQLRAAQASGDAALLARLSPAQWLQGWRLPGYDGFAQWCDDTAQQLQADWLRAGRRGLAPAAARYAGFSSRRALWVALLSSGGAAGLAGALEVAGPIGQLTPYVPAGYGFAAIIVAFVGRLHPAGMVLSAVLMSMFYIGGELAQSRLGLPKSLTGVFQGLLLFCLLACDTLIAYRVKWRQEVR